MIATKLKPPTTVTAQEFADNLAGVKRAATEAPVVVTDGGRPAHVLMSYEAYEALAKPQPLPGRTLLDIAREPGMAELFAAAAEVEFELPKREFPREINLE